MHILAQIKERCTEYYHKSFVRGCIWQNNFRMNFCSISQYNLNDSSHGPPILLSSKIENLCNWNSSNDTNPIYSAAVLNHQCWNLKNKRHFHMWQNIRFDITKLAKYDTQHRKHLKRKGKKDEVVWDQIMYLPYFFHYYACSHQPGPLLVLTNSSINILAPNSSSFWIICNLTSSVSKLFFCLNL